MSAPAKRIAPARGGTMPNTVRSSVDLPAPFAPMMQTISPVRTASDTPRSTLHLLVARDDLPQLEEDAVNGQSTPR